MGIIATLVMLAMLAVGLGIFSKTMSTKIGALLNAEPENRFDRLYERVDRVIVFMFGQKRLFKEPVSGLMHALIFWGFCVVALRTLTLFIMPFTSSGFHFHLPLFGDGFIGGAYALTKDIFEMIVLLSVIAAAFRRQWFRPARVTPSGEAQLILGLIATLMITDYLFDGWLFAQELRAGGELSTVAKLSPIGLLVAKGYVALGMDTSAAIVGQASFWIHCATILFFLNLLPLSKHFHVITVLFNVFFSRLGAPGVLDPITDMEERETFGVNLIEQYTWKQLLDVYSCTECGRCTLTCPAWNTGKPLAPKILIKDILENLHAHETRLAGELGALGMLWARIKKNGEEKGGTGAPPDEVKPDLITQVNEDVIWSCTTCRSCEENCPLLITHVDKIVDLRRYLVLMESRFPKELNAALKNLETKSNPWGLPLGERAAWAEGLDVPTLAEKPDTELLFFVGCAGSYDDRTKKVTKAVVKILKAAGVEFAILGKEEGCTGDPARRIGNEYLYQMQAEQNVEVMKGYGVKKVITLCPHCLNTIKNEYPQLGGDFEVEHYTDTVQRLLDEGAIKPSKPVDLGATGGGGDTTITYHDSCYLGRYNEIYESPRKSLEVLPGAKLVEMDKSHENGFCCGAGGGRWLMEEHIGKRINQERVDQAMEVKPDVIATACPYCLMMVEDGIREKGVEEEVRARDIAELVAAAL